MDKITHQVRAEHWARILNECMNSGMSKTAWCRKLMEHLRIHPYLQLQRQDNCLPFSSPYLLPRSNFLLCHQTHHLFSIRIL